MRTLINNQGIKICPLREEMNSFPFFIQNLIHSDGCVAHYAYYSLNFLLQTSLQHKVNAIFHVRPKGSVRTHVFPNVSVSGIDTREFPCMDEGCEGEMIQVRGGGPDGSTAYHCTACGYETSFP